MHDKCASVSADQLVQLWQPFLVVFLYQLTSIILVILVSHVELDKCLVPVIIFSRRFAAADIYTNATATTTMTDEEEDGSQDISRHSKRMRLLQLMMMIKMMTGMLMCMNGGVAVNCCR